MKNTNKKHIKQIKKTKTLKKRTGFYISKCDSLMSCTEWPIVVVPTYDCSTAQSIKIII